MDLETCSYSGEPSAGFSNSIIPIQPADIYSTESSGTESGILERNSCAPILADFTSELCGAAGAACGAIGGWQRVCPPIHEDPAGDKPLLPAVRFARDQLRECFGWLPFWRTPAFATTIELGERYAPHFIPAFRGGLVGCITGALGGYALGYLGGAAVDWCREGLSQGFNLFAKSSLNQLSNEIDDLKYKYLQNSNGSSEYASMQYWTSQYLANKALYENNVNYRDKIDRGYIAIGSAAGEAFLQRGSQVPSNDLTHPQYILKGTNYDLGSVALGYLLDARAAINDDNDLPNSDRLQLAICSERLDGQIKSVIGARHDMLHVLQELVDSNYGDSTFDIWKKCIRGSLDRKFLVSPELQNQYEAKCWRDLALIDLCQLNSVAPENSDICNSEMHQALESASELDPQNPDLLQLKQLSVTLRN